MRIEVSVLAKLESAVKVKTPSNPSAEMPAVSVSATNVATTIESVLTSDAMVREEPVAASRLVSVPD